MIKDILIIEELILQMGQNETKRKQIICRMKNEHSFIKMGHFMDEVQHIVLTNIEIYEMLKEAYLQGISKKELFKDIQP